jgi:hypothetical protein
VDKFDREIEVICHSLFCLYQSSTSRKGKLVVKSLSGVSIEESLPKEDKVTSIMFQTSHLFMCKVALNGILLTV